MDLDIVVARLEALSKQLEYWHANTSTSAEVFTRAADELATLTKGLPDLGDLGPAPKAKGDVVSAGTIARLGHRLFTVLAVARTLQARKAPALTIDTTGIFVAGQGYDAVRAFQRIIESATRELVLIDSYFGRDAMDALSARGRSVACRVLGGTKTPDPALVQLIVQSRSQHGPIELRGSIAFHDRFIFADDDVFTLGTSANSFGKGRTFMFARISEPVLIDVARKAFEAEWAKAPKQA